MKRRPGESEEEFNQRHNERMAKKKAAREKIIATKTQEKGLLIVHSGNGKGKSTAAFGLVIRALGNEKRVAVVQFVKGKWETGERTFLAPLPKERITFYAMGEGFTWDTQDRARDVAAANAAWQKAKEFLLDPKYDLVLLDELNIALRYEHLPLEDVIAGLQARAEGTHVVVTGRNAPEALINAADLVTEMTLVKHPFRAGVKAQSGIEF
ncbi:MAG: cob(I)yrinic acid a,c-diamide adenosyltransferase [Alphaproteobacteria bacterium]